MLKEGDKLPSENELCQSIEISRPNVREAILKLQEDEFDITKKGIGIFVLHIPLKDLSRFASAKGIPTILQSHDVRIALVVEALALVANCRSDFQLDYI